VIERLALAVDGGNSKTDLALIGEDGTLRALVRGPQSSLHRIGVEGAVDVLGQLLADACAEGGVEADGGPVAEVARFTLAGADLPEEEEELADALRQRRWAVHSSVANDTFAVLRAGTDEGWGVAVVCGARVNCVGVAPDGRQARFPALGAITGDWGGGDDVGLAALSAAARSADGRGPQTSLERAVPAYFSLPDPWAVARSIHLREIPAERIGELAPVVLAEADGDPVALEIAERQAEEIAAFARATLARLDLLDSEAPVILGGGVVREDRGWLTERVAARLAEHAPRASVRTVSAPPVLGAGLLALDELGSADGAHERLRAEIGNAAGGVIDG
jgi:N-acetylglucosamine kinase-like BadF-type ATPase